MRPVVLSMAVLLALAACKPAPVINPYKSNDRSRVERDVTQSVAPGGTVTGRTGSPVDLASLYADQRVVVVFYMGGWCPHCQKQLGELQARQREFADAGAILVGISADSAADATALHDKLGLNFELYGDPSLDVIQKWGVVDFKARIARPATFIVEPGGAISFRRVGETMNDRPSTDDVLTALQNSQ